MLRFTCGKNKLLLNYQKSQNIMSMIIEPKIPLISQVGPSPHTRSYSCDYQHEMMNY